MVWCIDKNSQTNSKSQNLGFDIHDHILEQGFGKFSSLLDMYICTYNMSKQLHYIYMVFGYQLTQNLCFSFPFNLNSHHGLEQAFEKLSNGMNMYAPGQKAAICDIWLPIFGSDEY